MMPIQLQERLEQLLSFARNPNWPITAPENLACAKELVNTVHSLGHLEPVEYKAHMQQITAITLIIKERALNRIAEICCAYETEKPLTSEDF